MSKSKPPKDLNRKKVQAIPATIETNQPKPTGPKQQTLDMSLSQI